MLFKLLSKFIEARQKQVNARVALYLINKDSLYTWI